MGLIGNNSLNHIFTLLKSELDLKANDDGSMFSAKPIPDYSSLAWCEPGIYYSTSTASDAPFSTAGFILIVFNADIGVEHVTSVYTQIIMSKPASDDRFNKSTAGATYIRNVYMYWTDKVGSIPGHYDVSASSWKRLDIMTGATSSDDGFSGLVPTPVSGENTKFLRGDGTWQTAYTLPTASSSTLGGVKIGTGISISSGTISLSNATSSTIGGVKVGSNITVSSGTISLTKANANTALFGSTSYFATPSNANITYTPATINMAAITDGAAASTYYGRFRSIFTSTDSSSFKGILINGRGGTSSKVDSVNGNVYLLGTDKVRIVNGMNIVTSGSIDSTTETSYGSIAFRLADSSSNILYDGLHINANGTADGALYLTGTNGVIFRNSPMPSIADGVDLGRTAMRWGTFYGNSINCSSTGIFGGTVRPSTSAGASLGSSTYKWNAIYGTTANIEGSIASQGTYDDTVDYSVNMYIGTSGVLHRTTKTSSRKIKHDILPLQNKDLKAENLYDIEVVQFKYNDGILSEEAQRIDTDMPGFIIEDLEKVYPIAVDKHGEEDSIYWSWNETYIIPGLVKLAQIHKERLDEQDNKISELEKRLEELEELVLN